MEGVDWAKHLISLPSKVDKILSNGSIYESQCFLFKSLVYSVAQYAELWIRFFPQVVRSQSAAAVGKELVKVLEEGMNIILQLCADKASPGLVLIVLGNLGQFREIIDDVRRYCHMVNHFISQPLPFDKIYDSLPENLKIEYNQLSMWNQIEGKEKLIDQIKYKVEIDCNTLQTFLTCGYEQDRLALIKKLSSSNDLSLGNLSRHYVSNGLIPALKTGVFPPVTCIESKDLSHPKGELGSGSFGNVWKASWCDFPVAVKEFKAEECPSFNNEFEVLSRMVTNSSHIVQLLGHCERERTVNDDIEKRRCLVLELMSKNLNALIGRDKIKPLFKTVDIILQIAKAMRHLHDIDVIYRDMKPGNILVKERKDQSLLIKLADFGASKANFETGDNTDMKGTMMYMAPEILEGDTNYSKKADVFSFGVVCSQILTGQKKLRPVSDQTLVKQIRDELKQKVLEMNIPTRLKDLINCCWEHEDHKRPTFAHVCDELWGIKEKLLVSETGIQNSVYESRDLRPQMSWWNKCSDLMMHKYFITQIIYYVTPYDFKDSSFTIHKLGAFDITLLCLRLSHGQVEIVEPYQTLIRPFLDGRGVDPQNLEFGNHQQDLGILGQFKKLLIDQGKKFNFSLGISVHGGEGATSDQIMFILNFLKAYPIFNGVYIHGRGDGRGILEVKVEQLLQALQHIHLDLYVDKALLPIERVSSDHVFVGKRDLKSLLNFLNKRVPKSKQGKWLMIEEERRKRRLCVDNASIIVWRQ